MKYFLVFIPLILISCTTFVAKPDKLSETGRASGTWSGYIERFSTKVLPNDTGEPIYQVVVLNCGEIPELYIKLKEGGPFQKFYQEYEVLEKSGNLLMNIIHDGGAWVESQTWGIVFISSKKADIQWSRMVSNIKKESTASLRSFGEVGYGKMEKISDSCDST
ncbi:hypothetical protein QT397_19860 [Microbulbifer sp. MKSA007]|nr:hypothetical protein QT397_19860 [Microbulbifer sp. MKSA007]